MDSYDAYPNSNDFLKHLDEEQRKKNRFNAWKSEWFERFQAGLPAPTYAIKLMGTTVSESKSVESIDNQFLALIEKGREPEMVKVVKS